VYKCRCWYYEVTFRKEGNIRHRPDQDILNMGKTRCWSIFLCRILYTIATFNLVRFNSFLVLCSYKLKMLISIKDLNDVKTKTISREDKWRTTWVMYLCARSVDLTSFYDCNIGFENCSDIMIFFHFSFEVESIVTVISITSRNRSKYYVGYTTQIATSEDSCSLSPLQLWVRTRSWRGVLDATLCDKVCHSLETDRVLRFPPPIKQTATI
jgi:hypothetical protein